VGQPTSTKKLFETRRNGRRRTPPVRTPEERNRLLEQRLLRLDADWVASYVRRKYGRRHPEELGELRQVGYLAAIHAADIWQEAPNGKLFLYVQNYIRFYAREFLIGLRAPVHVPHSTRYKKRITPTERVNLDKVASPLVHHETPEQQSINAETLAVVRKELAKLPVRERYVLCSYYGVGQREERTQTIARRLKLNAATVQAIRRRGLELLRGSLSDSLD